MKSPFQLHKYLNYTALFWETRLWLPAQHRLFYGNNLITYVTNVKMNVIKEETQPEGMMKDRHFFLCSPHT